MLGILGFTAGFIDAVVGGGGLIQLPALLINLPKTNLATIFGTNKIAALAGTSIAAYQYSKRITFNWWLLLVTSFCAGAASFGGAKIVSLLNSASLKPFMLLVLIVIAVYTIFKKDLGNATTKTLSINKQLLHGIWIGLLVGFYDGFFGPGTGSFLVLGFVIVLGFDFIKASAYAKVVNCMTNIGALVVFIKDGHYILEIAVLLAACNIFGNIVGSKMAIKKGNGFVRLVFLCIVVLMILRYGFDVYKHYSL